MNNEDVCDERIERAAKSKLIFLKKILHCCYNYNYHILTDHVSEGRLTHETLMEKANEILQYKTMCEVLSVEESATTADVKVNFVIEIRLTFKKNLFLPLLCVEIFQEVVYNVSPGQDRSRYECRR